MEPCWGSNVRVSNIIAKKSQRKHGQVEEEPDLLDKHNSNSARHINYHVSMVAKGFSGILDVNKKFDITSETDPPEKVDAWRMV